MFNSLATCFTISGYAIFEQDISLEYSKNAELLKFFLPEIYKEDRDKNLFKGRTFFNWVLYSLICSSLLYFLCFTVF